MTVTDFEELFIYQKSRILAKQIYEITRQGDFRFDTRFVQQIHAAAGSVRDNIAEGFERQGNKEFINFLYIAKGSCGEVRSQLIRAHDVGFIQDVTFESLYKECRALSAGILNMIKSLKQSEIKGSRFATPQTPQTSAMRNQTPQTPQTSAMRNQTPQTPQTPKK